MGRKKIKASERRKTVGTTLRPPVLKALKQMAGKDGTVASIISQLVEESPRVREKLREAEAA